MPDPDLPFDEIDDDTEPRQDPSPSPFHKRVVYVLLGLIALAILFGIIEIIPHPYAGYGTAAFLLLATPAWFYLPRARIPAILALAAAIATLVVLLHIHATHRITIRNDSGLDIASIHIIASQGDDSRAFAINGVPASYTVSFRFLFGGYDGDHLVADGQLSDGTRFFSPFLSPPPSAPYRGHTLLILHPDGTIEHQHP